MALWIKPHKNKIKHFVLHVGITKRCMQDKALQGKVK